MPGELIGSSSMRIPIFIANEYFSKQMAAYYGVVLRIAITPVSIILANVAQIFLHQVSSNYKNGLPSFVIFIKYFCGLFLVGLMGCVLVVAYGEDLIVLVLGNKYETVGILLVDILPYIFMLAVVSPLTSVLYIFEKQNYLFYNKSAFFLATLVCFGYGAYIEDFFVGARLYAIFMAIIYTVIFLEIFIILYKDKQLRGKV
jgi:O-antigen/teichoic acid export membrane protein